VSTGLDDQPRTVESRSDRWGEAPAQRQDQEGLVRRLQRVVARSLRILPKGVVRLFASSYIAGESLADGLRRCDEIYRKEGLHSTLDVLGEDVHDWKDVDAYHEQYRDLIEAIAERPHANISIKLSALGQLLDEPQCLERAEDIVRRAASVKTFVRLDMEDHTTVDSTLRIYRSLRERGHDNVGVVLQSRLFRTRDDVEQLKPLQPNVRLCIGIYREPAEIALQDKHEMKRHMMELLEVMWRNGQHVGLATHEEWCIREAVEMARRLGKPLDEVEVQMLLGVPRQTLQRELVAQGVRVRLYVPYGRQWYAYSMRRLENNPDVLASIVRSMLQVLFRRG